LLVQTATRRSNNPNANGPVEELLRSLSRRILDRAGRFTNRHRLRKLLLLMTMEASRHADTHAWTRVIQEALHECAGRPAKQRPHDDGNRTMSLFPGSTRPAGGRPGRRRGATSPRSGHRLVVPDPEKR
jgi:hypothetical protein